MASIQIRADRSITACEKYLIENKPLMIDRPLMQFGGHLPSTESIEVYDQWISCVRKIKNLAEYAIKQKPECRSITKKPTITIDHNDFELIGEFL